MFSQLIRVFPTYASPQKTIVLQTPVLIERVVAARKGKSSAPALPATYQTRISGFDGIDSGVGEGLLSAYADLYGRIQRRLFAPVSAGRSAASMKGEYLGR